MPRHITFRQNRLETAQGSAATLTVRLPNFGTLYLVSVEPIDAAPVSCAIQLRRFARIYPLDRSWLRNAGTTTGQKEGLTWHGALPLDDEMSVQVIIQQNNAEGLSRVEVGITYAG